MELVLLLVFIFLVSYDGIVQHISDKKSVPPKQDTTRSPEELYPVTPEREYIQGMYMSAQKKQEYLTSGTWKAFKFHIQARDSNQCQVCGSEDNLECHHITYERLGNEWDSDLVTLCRTHHQMVHDKYGYDRETEYPII